MDARDLRIEDYLYTLPQERIAKYPLESRELSKLLVYRSGDINQDIFKNIGSYLNNNDLLVFNKTKVIRARLQFKKETGASIEIFCLEPVNPADYESNFSRTGHVDWRCLVGNRKKWKGSRLKRILEKDGNEVNIEAEEIVREDKNSIIRFSWDDDSLNFSDILNIFGHMPIPPYLNRDDEEIDITRYQTVYSKDEGSVAAPTAGLHFTEDLLSKLKQKGIETETITLHVGAGTFVPVKTRTIGEHSMHVEQFSLSKQSIEALYDKRLIAVGTTSMRSLESLYWLGHKLQAQKDHDPENLTIEQWDPYETDIKDDYRYKLDSILSYMRRKGLEKIEARTAIIIVPGYSARLVRGLITNYHMPGSTLLLLVAAFTGKDWRKIYEYSLNMNFRFLSYGDSSLLLP